MRESIGQAFLYNLIIIIIVIIMFILVGAMAYSKTYKIKTKMVDIIEKHHGYDDKAREEIETYLGGIGYKINQNATQNCPDKNGVSAINEQSSLYRYCIYEFDNSYQEKGKYYGAIAYIYFEFPIIGDLIEIPVYGETEVFYDETYIEG